LIQLSQSFANRDLHLCLGCYDEKREMDLRLGPEWNKDLW